MSLKLESCASIYTYYGCGLAAAMAFVVLWLAVCALGLAAVMIKKKTANVGAEGNVPTISNDTVVW